MTRQLSLLTLVFGLAAGLGMAGSKYDYRIARLSYLEGHVSFQHAKDVDWTAASINMALQPSDRIYTGENGRAEIEFDDGSVLRLAEKTDIEILSLKEEFVQFRMLVGLATLDVDSSVNFEINTPAAAFNTLRRGVYRFDVAENGDSDGIVRKGLLEAANNKFSQRVETGELIHVSPGEVEKHTLSRYDRPDAWDEWTDRRKADAVAYESRKYVPNYVTAGVRDLDRYGRWVVADDYGPAWVPLYADAGWSPYWSGRWCYRPFWGWTWVSYEPWGWLPYHYGRWYHSTGFGWCWLPGVSFGFHFWSPGLVRFYHGPGWVSWCPLGPGDYYNVNHYYYRNTYNYHLNDLRLTQRRGPEDLANRRVPGAFRTVRADQFANESFGRGNRLLPGADGDQPWTRGRVVTGDLPIQPTARSFSPAPDRAASRPNSGTDRPVIVRTEPAMDSRSESRFSRITNPGIAPVTTSRYQERGAGEGSAGTSTRGSMIGPVRPESNALDRSQGNASGDYNRSNSWNRRVPEASGAGGRANTRAYEPPPGRGATQDGLVNRGRAVPENQVTRPEFNSPRRQESPPPDTDRNRRSTPSTRPPESERPAPERRSRPSDDYSSSSRFLPRYSSPNYESRPAPRVEQVPAPGSWRESSPPRYSAPSWGEGRGRAFGGGSVAPSFNPGRSFGGNSSPRSAPVTRGAPAGGSHPSAPSGRGRRDH